MNIEQMKLKDLKPYEKNAKRHDKTQIANVAESIRRFGFAQPLVVDKDNVLIIGHCRLLAAKQLKLREVPVLRMEDLTEEEVKQLRLLDNKLNESEWDIDLLTEEIPRLNWEGFDIDWGLSEYEGEVEIVEDEVPEPDLKNEPTAKQGYIYKLGEHRLMCGDSTNPGDVDKLMGEEMADLVFTDPPYGVSYKGTNNPNGREWTIIKNDTLRGDDLFLFLLEAFKNIKRKLIIGGAFYIWYANSNAVQFELALEGAELKKKQIIIWQKGMVLGHSDYHWSYEPCIYGCHPNQNSQWYGDRAQKTLWDLSKTELKNMKKDEMQALLERLYNNQDVWDIKRDPASEYVHPTQKPVALSAKAIHNSSKRDDIVLDLFGGSGSTLMGCEQLGRKARLMEFDPHYVDVIVKRWETFTNKKAELISK